MFIRAFVSPCFISMFLTCIQHYSVASINFLTTIYVHKISLTFLRLFQFFLWELLGAYVLCVWIWLRLWLLRWLPWSNGFLRHALIFPRSSVQTFTRRVFFCLMNEASWCNHRSIVDLIEENIFAPHFQKNSSLQFILPVTNTVIPRKILKLKYYQFLSSP